MAAQTAKQTHKKQKADSENQAKGVSKRSIIPSKMVPARAEEAKSKKNASNGSGEEAMFGLQRKWGRRGKRVYGCERKWRFGDGIYSERRMNKSGRSEEREEALLAEIAFSELQPVK